MAKKGMLPTYAQFARVYQENTGKIKYDLPVPKKIWATLAVGAKGWGFGEIVFIQDCNTGQLYIDAETSGKQTVLKFLEYMVDGAIMDTEKDPAKHRQYNKARGVISCGCGCGWNKRPRKSRK
jgi:hypothetical protein